MDFDRTNDLVFDRNQLKEYVTAREDDLGEFIGFRSCVARISGFVARMQALGEIDPKTADDLLCDVYHLGRLTEIGQRYAKWCRNPPAELEMMVLSRQKNLRQGE